MLSDSPTCGSRHLHPPPRGQMHSHPPTSQPGSFLSAGRAACEVEERRVEGNGNGAAALPHCISATNSRGRRSSQPRSSAPPRGSKMRDPRSSRLPFYRHFWISSMLRRLCVYTGGPLPTTRMSQWGSNSPLKEKLLVPADRDDLQHHPRAADLHALCWAPFGTEAQGGTSPRFGHVRSGSGSGWAEHPAPLPGSSGHYHEDRKSGAEVQASWGAPEHSGHSGEVPLYRGTEMTPRGSDHSLYLFSIAFYPVPGAVGG